MKKQISALLIAALMLSGCSAKTGTSSSKPSLQAEPLVAMGRYLEKDMALPQDERFSTNLILGGSINITQDDKIFVHVRGDMCRSLSYENGQWNGAGLSDEEMLKPVSQKYLGKDKSYFRSEDNAKPFIYERIENVVGEIIGPDGYTFSMATYNYTEADGLNQPSNKEKEKTEHFCAYYNGTDARYYDIPELIENLRTVFADKDTIRTYIDRISRQNVLILGNQNEYIFYDLSVDGGKKIGTLPALKGDAKAEAGFADHLAIIDDIVLVANGNGAVLNKLSTGEQIAQVQLEGIQKVTEGVDGTFYAINQEGIHRILPNGGIVQRVMDSSCYTFAAPAFRIKDFVQDNQGNFYVLGSNNDTRKLLKYEFSQNTPLEREKTLHLWSLRDNPTIREAAAEFMRQNPDVKVYIEIAPQDMPIEKATENVITALLAGTGPDLIMTDGVDLAKLDAQSVLAPISTEVSLLQYDNRLLPCGQLNNRQIAIGTKLFSSRNSPNDASQKFSGTLDIEALLNNAKAEKRTIEQMRQQAGEDYMINPILRFTSREDAFNAVYTAASAEIWQDGFNKAAAEIALQLMKEIDTKFMDSGEEYFISPICQLSTEYIQPYGSDRVQTAGIYSKANLVMSRMISYSANTQNADLCIAFINTMLSDYVQTAKINDGISATKTIKISSFDKNYKEIVENIFALDGLVRQNTGEILEIAPENIQIITENYIRDDGFKEIVFDYVDGKIDLDTALAKAEKL